MFLLFAMVVVFHMDKNFLDKLHWSSHFAQGPSLFNNNQFLIQC